MVLKSSSYKPQHIYGSYTFSSKKYTNYETTCSDGKLHIWQTSYVVLYSVCGYKKPPAHIGYLLSTCISFALALG